MHVKTKFYKGTEHHLFMLTLFHNVMWKPLEADALIGRSPAVSGVSQSIADLFNNNAS